MEPDPVAADAAPTEVLDGPVTGTTVTAAPQPSREPLTCPECGAAAMVMLNRRDASDFCATCDFPLFWTPAAVQREASMRADEDSLRRLPGTVGRVTVASLACPHCAEPNALSAQVCVRCGRPLHVEEPVAPAPEPVCVPPPAPEPEPDKRVPWWAWALVALGVAIIIVLIVLGANGYLG